MKNSPWLAAFALFAIACSDPISTRINPLDQSVSGHFAVDPTVLPIGGSGLVENQVEVCKTVAGDPVANWSFTFSVTIDAVPQTDVVLDNNTPCKLVVNRGNVDGAVTVVIAEQGPPTNWTLTDIHVQQFVLATADQVSETNKSATVIVNNDVARRVTFGNSFDEPDPDPVCTYTKGWYQNKNGSPTVIAVDGRTIAEAQAIFAATPGKPGSVTWGVGALTDNKPNALLNLYQQFLAALQNLGGDANEDNGPAAVDQAIDDVQAATNGSGFHISMLAGTDVSGLTSILSAFNEGQYPGFPHCSDEELPD